MRILAGILAVACCLAAADCSRRRRPGVATDESGAAEPSTVYTADLSAQKQLLSGFHEVEQNAWRWTMSKFSVALRRPSGASQRGATLRLKFSIPEPVIVHVKSITLSATLQGSLLRPETYLKAGEYSFERDIDARLLDREAVTAEFALDKFLPAGLADQRELGIVVSSIGLELK